VHPYLQKLFETGVDEMSWDDMDVMQQEDFAWPDIADVEAFRRRVKEVVEAAIAVMPIPSEGSPINADSPYWALLLGFEHERIHLETSSVLIHQLPFDCVLQPAGWRTAPTFALSPASAPSNSLVEVASPTDVVLGKPCDFPSFGWDNEYGKREVTVPPFAASRFLVSNAEFLPFVEVGGYTDKTWWVSPAGDDEGWRWRSYRNATHPSFWVAPSHPDFARYVGGNPDHTYQKDDGHAGAGTEPVWSLRTIFDIIPMPWDWPCEVNYHEASAFMRWKAANEGGGVSYRFPTEAEYHVARGDPSAWPSAAAMGGGQDFAGQTVGGGRNGTASNGKTAAVARPGGDAFGRVDVMMQPTAPGNVNFRWHSSTPVDFYGPSPSGFYDTHGNVWEWAEDHFAPLPGFEIHYLYDDFSSPCFDGWHTLILGGSWASTGDLGSSFARYHFRRHFFQHLGFRYVKVSVPEPYPGAATVTNLWEGCTNVSRELTDGYGAAHEKLTQSWALASPDLALQYNTAMATLVASVFRAQASEAAMAGASVMHLGCGVGGATFELARSFGSVVGLDRREASIRHARILLHHGQFEYERLQEGILTHTAIARVPEGVDRSRVTFVHADAESAEPSAADASWAQSYDVVVVDGLLTRTRQPLDVLSRATAWTKPGGLLIVISNNDWDPQVTPRNGWLGGFKMNGEDQSTLTMLNYSLKRAFVHVDTRDLARLSRHHARRFTLDVLQTTVWRKNPAFGPNSSLPGKL